MTRVAVVSYALDASKDEKILALHRGLADVIAALIVDFDEPDGDVQDRCEQAIDEAIDDRLTR